MDQHTLVWGGMGGRWGGGWVWDGCVDAWRVFACGACIVGVDFPHTHSSPPLVFATINLPPLDTSKTHAHTKKNLHTHTNTPPYTYKHPHTNTRTQTPPSTTPIPSQTCTAVLLKSPGWSIAYSSVSAHVTLWGSCLAKKSSATRYIHLRSAT